MSVRADWHIAPVVLPEDESDPFDMPIEEVGERIDLRDPKASLELRLRELLSREMSLDRAGIRCPIKDRPDSTCHACPVSQAHNRTEALGTLCRIGREQESATTELAVMACQDQ